MTKIRPRISSPLFDTTNVDAFRSRATVRLSKYNFVVHARQSSCDLICKLIFVDRNKLSYCATFFPMRISLNYYPHISKLKTIIFVKEGTILICNFIRTF